MANELRAKSGIPGVSAKLWAGLIWVAGQEERGFSVER
jgi:hypothetical protein